jgi:hypothetical protein
MVGVRPQTIIAGVASAGRLGPAGVDKAFGMVIARAPPWSRQPLVLRNTPMSITSPSEAQVAIRMALAALASKAKGKTWKDVKKELEKEIAAGKVSPNIPPAAMHVQAGKDKFKEVLKAMEALVEGMTLKELRDQNRKKYLEVVRERARTKRTLRDIRYWVSARPGVKDKVEKVVGPIIPPAAPAT